MDELILDLVYPFLNFKSFYSLRSSSKQLKEITEQPHYWKIINFTDYPTLDNKVLTDRFSNDYLHVVNVTKKNNSVYSFPKNLLLHAKHIKIIML